MVKNTRTRKSRLIFNYDEIKDTEGIEITDNKGKLTQPYWVKCIECGLIYGPEFRSVKDYCLC